MRSSTSWPAQRHVGKFVSSGFIAGIGVVVGTTVVCAGLFYLAIVEKG